MNILQKLKNKLYSKKANNEIANNYHDDLPFTVMIIHKDNQPRKDDPQFLEHDRQWNVPFEVANVFYKGCRTEEEAKQYKKCVDKTIEMFNLPFYSTIFYGNT